MVNGYPENDYREYLQHGTKGKHWTWEDHKYISKKDGRYIYPEASSTKDKLKANRKMADDISDFVGMNSWITSSDCRILKQDLERKLNTSEESSEKISNDIIKWVSKRGPLSSEEKKVLKEGIEERLNSSKKK